ncbi:cell wall hydrolase [Qipengyuania qiaonensis]|uniref:Cell wall hydrolase n=1 Tax=Qipengyuania qiaonensis TaxID=2867240 RepID=A0ABS7J4H8_9SPHN|nr:cell wall hydrolase [Qipengyuania qiaonensis]MBX7482229.1 cell wall hydrolase [Qipengyuania qiaonensis]
MIRKTTGFSAIVAATALTILAGAEGSGANAQVAAQATEVTAAEAQLTEEVVPVFVEKPVVQELPEDAEVPSRDSSDDVPQADSLRELVSQMPTTGQLSEELRCLAGAVYFESRGEPLDGQLAVAQVIINRAEDNRFPSSYCGVVYQRSQFSFVKRGRMPHIRTGSTAWKRAEAIARIAHRGLWDSLASDALFFHANYVRPVWSHRKVALATIDTHVFYR